MATYSQEHGKSIVVHYLAPGAKGNLCNGANRGLLTGYLSAVTCGECAQAALELRAAILKAEGGK